MKNISQCVIMKLDQNRHVIQLFTINSKKKSQFFLKVFGRDYVAVSKKVKYKANSVKRFFLLLTSFFFGGLLLDVYNKKCTYLLV